MRTLLLSLPLAMLLSCSGGNECDERSCADGCCGADGVCRVSGPRSCGLKGAACADCTRSLQACVEGACEPYERPCFPNDTVCTQDAECCTQICSKGRCSDKPCKTLGLSCATTSDCCSDLCHEGVCISPRTLGEACALTAPCQSPLVCREGFCAAPCVPQNQTCSPGVDQCCGGGACPPQIGICPEVCRGEGAPCNDVPCCGALQCVSGICTA